MPGRIRIYYLLVILTLLSCSKVDVPGDMVYIPAGEFIMGSEEIDPEGFAKEFGVRKGGFYEDEGPARKVTLKAFFMDKYEVTNGQYKAFTDASGHTPPITWEGGTYPEGKGNHPVSNVSWYDAHAYCKWAGKRLPTEEEWEKAARGPHGNVYPWGNEYGKDKANLDNTDITNPVGSYKSDRSYYGVYDMGGNVMEWVASWYEPYPGSKADNKDFGRKHKVLRGGAGGSVGHYNLGKVFARATFRQYNDPSGSAEDGGFRCAADAR